MSGWAMGVIELGLIFLPILAWAIWELWSLKREKRRDAVLAERARHAEGQHGADDGGSQTPQ